MVKHLVKPLQVLLLTSTPFCALAQGQDLVDEGSGWFEDVLEFFGSSNEIDLSNGMDWGVLPGPFANPEQGIGIGVAAVGLYAPQGLEVNQISTLTLSGYVSSEGTYGIGVANTTFLNENQWKLGLMARLSQTPSKYWGIGKEAAEDDGNETDHEAVYLNVEPTVSYQFVDNYFIKTGVAATFLYHQSSDGTALDPEQLENKTNLGIILGIEYDTRDYETNPYTGRLVSLEHRWFVEAFGADYKYEEYTFNYREYWNLYEQNVLALDYFVQGLSDSDLPWFAMSKLGGDNRMRGYYYGRYRDRYQMAAQLEYRHKFNERHGAVIWGGAGNIAPHFKGLFEDSWLPTYGVGYRFAFKPRVNVRLDLGFGDETTVYFNIHEAF
ncbi:BamA/TamA family outer membrane protein [Vibrio breoganii]|uniref:BamA/TamA family outer membrane protein n=1 Tax=Vibrio breoganii TaxID=553239 RepID=UPI001F52F9D8|nr:BamA/TamA family outer membrane protein [Vibrio breoganii]